MNLRKYLGCVFIVFMATSLTVMSCDVFGGLASPEDSGAAFIRFMEPVGGEIDLSLYATDPGRKAYVVFTTGYDDDLAPPVAAEYRTIRSVVPSISADRNRGAAEHASEARRKKFRESLERIEPASSRSLSWAGDIPADDNLNDTSKFKVIVDLGTVENPDYYSSIIDTTCRFERKGIQFGTNRIRSLSIWVADDCWEGDPTKINQVTEIMVEKMAKAFFGISNVDPVSDNPSESIYAWVTNLLGDEWGDSSSFINKGRSFPTIEKSDNVTILIADIYEQNTDSGGVVGYFDWTDLVAGASGSNERVMFAIDAVMFASADGAGGENTASWDPKDYWPQEIFSTLAHEFQHLIHFYQKGVVAKADLYYEPTWIDELCSMQVEDLIADKMGVPGPRGVDPMLSTAGAERNTAGRLPDFIYSPDISLADWGGVDIYASYAAAYAFGAYLTRNYGGASFIRSVVQSSFAGVNSIVTATEAFSGREESIENLLRRWGVAVLLSDSAEAPEYYRYGAFSSILDGVSYNLGAINVWNYSLGLDSDNDKVIDMYQNEVYVYTADTLSTMYGGAYSNAFMTLGDPSARPDWKITVPEGMFATIVID